MTTEPNKANAVEKALKILLLLSTREKGLSTGEISEELGFTLPTASRLLNTLAKHAFVRKSDPGKKYILGKSAADIGKVAFRHMGSELAPIARPFVDELRDTVKESAMIEVLEGDHTLIITRANGPNVVNIRVGEGTLIPAHVSAGGKALLAFSPDEVITKFLKKPLPRFTEETAADPDELKKQLADIRRTGVAHALGDYNLDVHALGAPILNSKKKVIAAVTVTMPAFRAADHKQSDLIAALKKTARKISGQLKSYDL